MPQGKSTGTFKEYREELKKRSFARAERFEVEYLELRNENNLEETSNSLENCVVSFILLKDKWQNRQFHASSQ